MVNVDLSLPAPNYSLLPLLLTVMLEIVAPSFATLSWITIQDEVTQIWLLGEDSVTRNSEFRFLV